jgi:hypothetical protein
MPVGLKVGGFGSWSMKTHCRWVQDQDMSFSRFPIMLHIIKDGVNGGIVDQKQATSSMLPTQAVVVRSRKRHSRVPGRDSLTGMQRLSA